jgi:hypothetical protein
MATTQSAIPTPQIDVNELDWNDLAQELKLKSPEEAMLRAFEIARFVAEVEKDQDQKLMLKERGKYFNLTLLSSAK